MIAAIIVVVMAIYAAILMHDCCCNKKIDIRDPVFARAIYAIDKSDD